MKNVISVQFSQGHFILSKLYITVDGIIFASMDLCWDLSALHMEILRREEQQQR